MADIFRQIKRQDAATSRLLREIDRTVTFYHARGAVQGRFPQQF
nr:MAG TPA: hypothetical protein [Caudoviricetes sp.]